MNSNAKAITDKQKAVTKSIAELVDVLSDIAVSDDTNASDSIVCEDGTVMVLEVDTSGDNLKTTVTVLRKDGLKYTIVREQNTGHVKREFCNGAKY